MVNRCVSAVFRFTGAHTVPLRGSSLVQDFRLSLPKTKRRAPMASATTAARSCLPKFRYLSAWFCPFAHRATLALEHHKGRVEYEWIEALGWFQQEDTENVTGTGKEWYYHWKADEVRF